MAELSVDGEIVRGPAEFVVPADSGLIVAVLPSSKLTNNVASDLRVTGVHEGERFELSAPICYTRRPGKDVDTGWSLVSPMNHAVSVEYGEPERCARGRVLLTNFDYDCGDAVVSSTGWSRVGTPFSVQLRERKAVFRRRADYDSVYPLVRAGLLRTASLTDCSFNVEDLGADEVIDLATDIASLLTFAHGGTVGVAMLELLSQNGRLVRRIIPQPVGSRFRDDPVVKSINLPQLFEECFAEHSGMRRGSLPWPKLPSYCGSLDDMPYMEQKFASLMMALEFFIRLSLLEHGLSEGEVTALEWNQLIGAARSRLGWEIPGHYTRNDVARLVRNAVMHGKDAPVSGNEEFRLLFNKWRLFLFRRVLIRLGYGGQVISPFKGFEDLSAVNDFTEERNSFEKTEEDSHPFAQFVKYLKEHGMKKGILDIPKPTSQ